MILETWTDVSQHQNGDPPQPINFERMRDAGAVGVCIRKSVGYKHDRAFAMNWRGAGDAGMQRTIYFVPFPGYSQEKTIRALIEWPDGGPFDEPLDAPAWADIEREHNLPISGVIEQTLRYLYFARTKFGGCEVYTAKDIWERKYSRKPGWGKDWDLVVANYRPELYGLPVETLKQKVLELKIAPALPIGWAKTAEGAAVPAHMAWRYWQISANGNYQGAALGVHSRDIDIGFRQLDESRTPVLDRDDLVRVLFKGIAHVQEAATALVETL